MASVIITYELIWTIITKEQINILNLIVEYVLQRRQSALWFLTCLFIIEIIMFFVIKIQNIVYQSASIIVLTIIGLIYQRFIGVPLIWNVDTALTSVAFFYVGYLFRKTGTLDKCFSFASSYKFMIVLILGIINLVGAVLNNKISGGGLEMVSGQYGCWPITYIVAIVGAVAVLIFAGLYTNKCILYLGENSLIYFGLHQSVIMPIVNEIYKKLNLFQDTIRSSASIILESFITLFIILSVLTLFNEIIKRSKLKFLIGK